MKDSYIVVNGFMVKKLGLAGTELLTYALIYGFTRDNKGLFTGSSEYIGETIGVSRITINKALANLTDKKYIIKENGILGTTNTYKVNMKIIGDDTTEDVTETKKENKNKPINWETAYNNSDSKFDELWELYGKVGSKKLAFKQWYKLTDEQKEKAYDNVPDYFSSLNDLKYKKHMERYISQELYLQEFTSVPKTNNLFGSTNTAPARKRNKLN